MIIDAHQHFWNFDKVHYHWPTPAERELYRNIEPKELEPFLRKANIDYTVAVQAENSYEETEYLLELSRQYDWIAGVVGWVPLNRPDEANRKLEIYKENPKFKGVRHLIHCESDPDWVIRDEVLEGLKHLATFDLSFDIVAVFPNHLEHIPTIAKEIPELKMVIDHLGKPPIITGEIERWAQEISFAADYPNVFAKLSGLNTAANWEHWQADDLQPYIAEAIRMFGSERLMYGSDWPVSNLAGDYNKVWTEMSKSIASYSKKEIEAILGGTAARFYKIK